MIEPQVGCRYAVVRVNNPDKGVREYVWGSVQGLDDQQALICFHRGNYFYSPPELVSLAAIESLYMEPPRHLVDELNEEMGESSE